MYTGVFLKYLEDRLEHDEVEQKENDDLVDPSPNPRADRTYKNKRQAKKTVQSWNAEHVKMESNESRNW